MSRAQYEEEFRSTPLLEKSILDVQYLKNANGGDARTLEDCGFKTCIDLYTFWFYEKQNLRKILENPIIPWKVCNLNEGFEERNRQEARNHLEKVLKSQENLYIFERFPKILENTKITKEVLEKLGFPAVLNLYIFWCYEAEKCEKLLEGMEEKSEIVKLFEYAKNGNCDLAWKSIDKLLRKRTAFISHLLVDYEEYE